MLGYGVKTLSAFMFGLMNSANELFHGSICNIWV